MVAGEDTSAVKPAISHNINIKNMNNYSQSSSPDESTSALGSASDIIQSAEIPVQSFSLEAVCQTAGFINSQKVTSLPSNVRFVVQPVAEEGVRKTPGQNQDEDNNQHSVQSFAFLGAHASADDINGYSKLGFILINIFSLKVHQT